MEADGTPAPPFIPGLTLSAAFYDEIVRPLVDDHLGGAPHSAARLDGGSDVLGFDTEVSRDHGWGPRVTVYLGDAAFEETGNDLARALDHAVPEQFRGYATRFAMPTAEDPNRFGLGVAITTAGRFFREYVGFDPRENPSHRDWLGAPSHPLCTVAAGRVFHDGLRALAPIRDALRWYPHDLWIYLLATQWNRIAQEESFMARCGNAGDDLGSRIVASRQVVEIMRLAFLYEQTFPPYFKWFGRAFAQLPCAASLGPILAAVIEASSWRERESHLSRAYVAAAGMHNALGLTPRIEPTLSSFHERPYQTIDAGRFAAALDALGGGADVRGLVAGVGAVWQFIDCNDILYYPDRAREALRTVA